MRYLSRYAILCTAVALGSFGMLGISTADAGSSPSACLTSINPREADPQPRDVHFVIAANKQAVVVTACMVSDLDRIAQASVDFSIFDSYGELVAVGGQSLGAVPPTDGVGPSNPKIIQVLSTDIAIDPKYANQILNQTVIDIQWAPCKAPAPAPCESDSVRSTTFLRNVVFDTSAAMALPRIFRHRHRSRKP